MPKESVSLYFREGSSDKVYQASIEERQEGACVVNFQFGRRGSALQSGTKTAKAVPYDAAKKIFDKLVREKTAKGYKPDAAGAEYVNASREERDTGLRPQLLNPVEEADVERLIADPDFWMQEKQDGRRCLLKKAGGEVTGTNRLGLAVGLPKPIVDAAGNMGRDFVLDGELMGERIVAFDLLSLDGRDLSATPYSRRLSELEKLCPGGWPIVVTLTEKDKAQKRAKFDRLKRDHSEGVVFKRHDAPYKPGRPSSGGDQLKYKFYATASCLVEKGRAGKRSVALSVFDGDNWINVGNVTVPANQPIPKPGQVVEVRYLYCYIGGSLFQPTLLGIRDDVRKDACVVNQLKLKINAGDDEPGS